MDRCQLCQTEVEYFCVATLGDEDVSGFDVAMDNALGMSCIETLGDLYCQL